MATNPNIAQGTLNRLRGSVVVTDFPALNITAPFLGRGGISISFEGETTTFINTNTGAVTSPEPYQATTVTVNLLKTQGLAAQYEAQRQTLSTIGDITVVSDATTLPAYNITNCAILNVRELSFNGEDAGYVVTLHGYYSINNALWNLV